MGELGQASSGLSLPRAQAAATATVKRKPSRLLWRPFRQSLAALNC